MADIHPAFQSTGPILQIVRQLRKSFPSEVTAETLKKLGLAGGNESRIINVLKFVQVIDEQGKKTSQAASVFSMHNDDEFHTEFSSLVKNAYTGLFELHGDDAWELSKESLISFFRQADQTSAVTGSRQAIVFQALSTLSGKMEIAARNPSSKRATNTPSSRKTQGKSKSVASDDIPPSTPQATAPQRKKVSDFGLTVRVEINLPTSGDQETYDRIFRSIRQNLIDVE